MNSHNFGTDEQSVYAFFLKNPSVFLVGKFINGLYTNRNLYSLMAIGKETVVFQVNCYITDDDFLLWSSLCTRYDVKYWEISFNGEHQSPSVAPRRYG